jgi:hypothetical protein
MTVMIHAERVKAHALGDLAESLVDTAGELAFLVRTEGRDAIGAWLDSHGLIRGATVTDATRAFLVVLAAMIPVDATLAERLDWVTWDEFGQQLPGTAPVICDAPDDEEGEHGTIQAYWRHRKYGHQMTQMEACGCAQAGRDYANTHRTPGQKAARVADYAELRAGGTTIDESADRIGVSRRTADRYEARLLAEGRATRREADGEAA